MTKPNVEGRGSPRPITPELLREALQFVPVELGHDERMRVFAAAWDGLGDDAQDLALEWAAGRAKPDRAEDLATWKSVRKPGKVKIGTLLWLAKRHGFSMRGAGDRVAAPDPAAVAAAQAVRAKRQAELENEYRAAADGAATAARRIWEAALAEGASPYLARKGVQAHGVRFQPGGTLIVPMVDAAGELQNLQRIAPVKAEGKPEKRYLAGGRKTGLCHWIGTPDGAPVLLLGEGYATCATLHEATGRPVAVCFDAGNLVHVAKLVRQRHLQALVLVCGDDDRETEARTGRNPGREKAASAARAAAVDQAAAGAVFPADLPEGGSDWNDLASAVGLTVVREQIERAIAAPEVPKPRRNVTSAADAVNTDRKGRDDQHVEKPAAERPRAEPDQFGFLLDERGVWHYKRDGDGGWTRPQWLCAPLRVEALTRADDANGWGYLLEFADRDGNAKFWAMPSALLGGQGAEWSTRLRDMGLEAEIGQAARDSLARYVNTRRPEARVTCTDRVGWHNSVYVLPSGSIGQADGRRYVFQSEAGIENPYHSRGELAQWRDQVAALCAGNSRLVFGVSAAFAGAVLRFSGLESGGFTFKGNARGGKTTVLRAAASVWGRPSYVQSWRTTSNALEATAAQHCDGTLILDELGQVDPREIGEAAYLLANESEKGRATRTGLSRKRRTWKLLFLSSGEVGLADHMAEAGQRVRAGQEVRMVDMPIDAGVGLGGLEELHGMENAPALAEAVKERAGRFYGTAGRNWLQWCAERVGQLPDMLAETIDQQRLAMVPESASGQVRTVGSRFALIGAAGELATSAGLTGWPVGEAARCTRKCFEDWLAERGHMDNSEPVQMVRQVRAMLERNGEAAFTWLHRAMDDHKPNTPMRLGFRRLVDQAGTPLRFDAATDYLEKRSSADSGERAAALVEYLVLPEAFKRDVCKGLNHKAAAAELRRLGYLRHDRDRLTMKQRLPGMDKVACYVITPAIFEDDL